MLAVACLSIYKFFSLYYAPVLHLDLGCLQHFFSKLFQPEPTAQLYCALGTKSVNFRMTIRISQMKLEIIFTLYVKYISINYTKTNYMQYSVTFYISVQINVKPYNTQIPIDQFTLFSSKIISNYQSKKNLSSQLQIILISINEPICTPLLIYSIHFTQKIVAVNIEHLSHQLDNQTKIPFENPKTKSSFLSHSIFCWCTYIFHKKKIMSNRFNAFSVFRIPQFDL